MPLLKFIYMLTFLNQRFFFRRFDFHWKCSGNCVGHLPDIRVELHGAGAIGVEHLEHSILV